MAKMADMTSRQGLYPQVSYNSSNILGTPIPKVGDQRGNPTYSAVVGQSYPNKINVVVVSLVLIGGGYLLWHLTFEK